MNTSAGAGALDSASLYTWITHPVEAFGAFKGMMTKKAPVEINEEFLESMQGVTNLRNPSIEKLLNDYSKNPEMVKSINERKFAGVRARYQLINLISSMLHYLNEYRKTRSTPLLQIAATENLLDDLLLYLVYLYEKDVATKVVQDKLRALGQRNGVRNTMSQNMGSSFVDRLFGRPQEKYKIPAKFNEALNNLIYLNEDRAKIWGLVQGSGVREGSLFPFLKGTDDDELSIEGLSDIMVEYLQMARAVERRKIRVLGDTNYKTGSPTDNAEKLASLESSLEQLSTRPDLEAVLHFGPSRRNGRAVANNAARNAAPNAARNAAPNAAPNAARNAAPNARAAANAGPNTDANLNAAVTANGAAAANAAAANAAAAAAALTRLAGLKRPRNNAKPKSERKSRKSRKSNARKSNTRKQRKN
jgi:hypothetical protein